MIEVIPYADRYEKGVQELFSIPVSGNIKLSLERHPHYLSGAYIQTEIPEIYICIDSSQNNKVIGVFNVGTRRFMHYDRIIDMPYFCDLRIHPSFQNGTVIFRILRFYDKLSKSGNRFPALTIIFDDNRYFLELIRRANSRPKGLVPRYNRLCTIQTHIFKYNSMSQNTHYTITQATEQDIPAMMQLQSRTFKGALQPYYDFSMVGKSSYYEGLTWNNFYLAWREKKLIGIMSIWDTRLLKQTRVVGYEGVMKYVRPFYQLIAAGLCAFPPLPPSGSLLQTKNIHCVILENRDIHVFRSLLNRIADDYPKSVFLISLDESDPLQVFFKKKWNKVSKSGGLYVTDTVFKEPYQKTPFYHIDAPRI